MDTNLIELGKWALQIGGPMAGLLVLFFYFYRRDLLASAAEMKQVSEERRLESATLIAVIRENTAALTKMAEVVQSLHQHMFNGERRSQ